MMDDIALNEIANQLGALGINLVLVNRDLSITKENLVNKTNECEHLNSALTEMTEHRDALQREVHRYEAEKT